MSATQSSSKSVDTPPSICDRNLIRAPGPGKYELSKYSDFSTTTTPLHSHANRWSFTGKQHDRHPRLTEETPGPDKYSHPVTSFGGIKYTMAKRLHTVSKEEREQNRQAQQMTADGKPKASLPPAAVRSFIGSGPKFSMAGRVRPIRADATPDPTKYNPMVALAKVTHQVPAYSMAAKPRTILRDSYSGVALSSTDKSSTSKVNEPAPPSVKSLIGSGGPRYSMSGRTRFIREQTLPGPGAYPGANLDMVGKSGPKFSMSARVKKGIAYGYWGDESRLSETARNPPSLQVVQSH